LFGMGKPMASREATTPPATGNSGARTANPSAGKARAKVRSDDAAIARGAELARTRAKASKSRRTEG
jgi:hypothetical protein